MVYYLMEDGYIFGDCLVFSKLRMWKLMGDFQVDLRLGLRLHSLTEDGLCVA